MDSGQRSPLPQAQQQVQRGPPAQAKQVWALLSSPQLTVGTAAVTAGFDLTSGLVLACTFLRMGPFEDEKATKKPPAKPIRPLSNLFPKVIIQHKHKPQVVP